VLLRATVLAGSVLTLAGSVLTLAACGGSSKQAAPTMGGPDLPPGCTVSEVDRIITGFLAKPDLAPPSFFQVYAAYESDGRSFVTRNRAKALAHLRVRLLLGERDRMIQLRVAPQDVNHVRITYKGTRYAPDFRRRGIYMRLTEAGGTIDCAHGKVAAWAQRGP
jgi:hypothetical protein